MEPSSKKFKLDDSNHIDLSTGRASGGADSALGTVNQFNELGEFHLIDAIETQGSDASGNESENDSDSLYDSEVAEDEIDALLDEGLPDEMKSSKCPKKKSGVINESAEKEGEGETKATPYEKKEKILLVEKGVNHFEVLPEGWVEVVHNSGMPAYLHKESRVCTFSRPYFLGSGSVRKHNIPLSAIPCLKYLRDIEESEKEKEKENTETGETNDKGDQAEDVKNPAEDVKPAENDASLPTGPLANALVSQSALPRPNGSVADDPNVHSAVAVTRVQSVADMQKHHSVEPEELNLYCQRRFQFKTLNILRFKTWGEKRRHEKAVKIKNRPQLPDDIKLITLKRKEDATTGTRDWVMNPRGKSYVCILHQYVQQVLKDQPKYEFKEVDNAATPYAATITINEVVYGTGYGGSKKLAKLDAARVTLEILLPELGKKIQLEKKGENSDLSFFDEIKVEDPRVPELCNKTSELSPYSILLNCLQRNFGLSSTAIECRLVTQKNQKNEFVMTVGKHSAQVSCRNKKDGKQRASQAILQKLHPHINSWGSMLRLYGSRSLQPIRERKAEEQEVTLLQTNASMHQPNNSIINKLKEEMLKLKDLKNTVEPIAKFLPPENMYPPSCTGSELNNVDL